MVDFLLRLAGSAVIGWLLGAAAGSTVSRVFNGGEADQLPMLFVPLTIGIVFLASYGLVPRRT
ncbi:MAG: hypothetical protein ACM3L9_05285 [Deltaproteobacteria bacterium]